MMHVCGTYHRMVINKLRWDKINDLDFGPVETQFSGLLAVSDLSIWCSLNGKLMALYLFMCIVEIDQTVWMLKLI